MHLADSLPADFHLDELTRLELLIARRADELSRDPNAGHAGRDWWSEAEQEVWKSWSASEPAQLAC